jgi:hypothetical protein
VREPTWISRRWRLTLCMVVKGQTGTVKGRLFTFDVLKVIYGCRGGG